MLGPGRAQQETNDPMVSHQTTKPPHTIHSFRCHKYPRLILSNNEIIALGLCVSVCVDISIAWVGLNPHFGFYLILNDFKLKNLTKQLNYELLYLEIKVLYLYN